MFLQSCVSVWPTTRGTTTSTGSSSPPPSPWTVQLGGSCRFVSGLQSGCCVRYPILLSNSIGSGSRNKIEFGFRSGEYSYKEHLPRRSAPPRWPSVRGIWSESNLHLFLARSPRRRFSGFVLRSTKYSAVVYLKCIICFRLSTREKQSWQLSTTFPTSEQGKRDKEITEIRPFLIVF